MHKKLSLSIAMAVIGACLLVASSFAGAASASAPQKSGSSEVKKGGTLRFNASNTDFEYTDPALAYDSLGWQMLFAVNMGLLNYPDKPGAEGARLVPEAAAGFPRVSRDGKTYTFTVRKGIKFSDGSALTAAAFKRAFERAADPKQASPAIAFMHTIVGADARNAGKAGSITGVTAKGQTLTVRLTQADPTFLAQVAMPFFAAVKPSMPIDAKGDQRLSLGRPVQDREPRRRSSARARAEPALQGEPPGEPRPDRLHGQHRAEPEPPPGARRPGRLRRRRASADGARRLVEDVRRPQGRPVPLLRQLGRLDDLPRR